MSDLARQLADFICGMAPAPDGRWYDEAAKTERGNFWWRKYVRQMQAHNEERVSALEAENTRLREAITRARDGMATGADNTAWRILNNALKET